MFDYLTKFCLHSLHNFKYIVFVCITAYACPEGKQTSTYCCILLYMKIHLLNPLNNYVIDILPNRFMQKSLELYRCLYHECAPSKVSISTLCLF